MPVIDIAKDIEHRTLTITAEFAAPVERVWALYEDPRQLEQVWGPPTYPATFVEHELRPGARTIYYMTSPEGERFGGYMEITEVERPTRFAFRDGFADDDLNPNPDMPVAQSVYTFEPTEAGTRVVYTSTYATAEGLQTVLEMGVEEGSTSAINQIDEFLARDSQPA